MIIAGIDEVGRGPLAGPVVSAAVCFNESDHYSEFIDSKKLSPKKRELLSEKIKIVATGWCICAAGPQTIDRFNIRGATMLAMEVALQYVQSDSALVDGNMRLRTKLPHEAVVKGDAKHFQIGAASILAKVWRDRLLCEYENQYPGYGFQIHAGYPTPFHKEALQRMGPCPIHRRSFKPVAVAEQLFGTSISAEQLHPNGDILVITAQGKKALQTPGLRCDGREDYRSIPSEDRAPH